MASNTYLDSNGYWRYKDSGKFVHRAAGELKLRRKLKPGEVVHHIDRDKTNNSFRNLYVFRNQEEHNLIHEKDARRFGRKASYLGSKRRETGSNISNFLFDC
jgi:HNH endonuclease